MTSSATSAMAPYFIKGMYCFQGVRISPARCSIAYFTWSRDTLALPDTNAAMRAREETRFMTLGIPFDMEKILPRASSSKAMDPFPALTRRKVM